ncbi:MAG: fibrobacter succinogenes major paralogous domain-containing protein [Bacteroidetes bacterium]|nr:fibrobacter succinogenes major paralogous domain-containing protein [Bacteroidota bacterium]
MKKRTNFFIGCFLLVSMGMVFCSSCKKSDDSNNSTPPATTVTDVDGNVYHTVKIGTQTWMLENLKTTKYRNGNPIPNVTDPAGWYNLTTGAYCNYNNDQSNATTYGRLYNWYAATDTRNICPTGWHIPTDAEWTILTDFLGGESVAGGKMKESGTAHWISPNTGATNSSGFTALPGGFRTELHFGGIGDDVVFLSSTIYSTDTFYKRQIYTDESMVNRDLGYLTNGNSVRCIKD